MNDSFSEENKDDEVYRNSKRNYYAGTSANVHLFELGDDKDGVIRHMEEYSIPGEFYYVLMPHVVSDDDMDSDVYPMQRVGTMTIDEPNIGLEKSHKGRLLVSGSWNTQDGVLERDVKVQDMVDRNGYVFVKVDDKAYQVIGPSRLNADADHNFMGVLFAVLRKIRDSIGNAMQHWRVGEK